MKDPFLEHRKQQEKRHLEAVAGDRSPMNSLITVELNITELCNRVCVFCPRVDPEVYPNRNLMMKPEVAEKVARDLAGIRYKGRISFSGFGEPFLHKGFADFIRIFRSHLPQNTIETNTNGDFLKTENTRRVFEAGLTYLYVNLYDGPDQREPFHKLMSEAGVEDSRYRLRDHWVGASEDFGLNLNNRSGMVSVEGSTSPADLRGHPCYYPFYKMLVDWDGQVLFCSNDWGRKIVVGHVLRQSTQEIWLSEEMGKIRRRLLSGDRSVSPCNTCSVVGTLHGKSSVDLLKPLLPSCA